jgi:hypothetical protein
VIKSQITIEGQGKMTLARFDGLADLSRYVAGATGHEVSSASWAGSTMPEAIDRALSGNAALVPASDRLLAELAAINPPSSAWQTQGAVAGGVVNVPAYLAGQPVNMRLRRRIESQGAPLSIIVDCVTSGGVDHGTITRRGAAVLALVRALAGRRPVTLTVIGGMSQDGKTACVAIPIDTAPLDLARAAWALGSVEVARHLAYTAGVEAMGKKHARFLDWAFNNHEWQTQNLCAAIAPHIGADQFVGVSSVVLGTAFADTKSAAQWVRDTIQLVTE